MKIDPEFKRNWEESTPFQRLMIILFFIGIIGNLVAIHFFRLTFIKLRISLAVYFISGACGLIFYFKEFKDHMLYLFLGLLFSIVSFGGICSAVFLSVNYYSASDVSEEVSLDLYDKGQFSSKQRNPHAKVQFESMEKMIIFSSSEKAALTSANTVKLKLAKGVFNYKVIKEKQLE